MEVCCRLRLLDINAAFRKVDAIYRTDPGAIDAVDRISWARVQILRGEAVPFERCHARFDGCGVLRVPLVHGARLQIRLPQVRAGGNTPTSSPYLPGGGIPSCGPTRNEHAPYPSDRPGSGVRPLEDYCEGVRVPDPVR